MNIVIAGAGRVGRYLAFLLSSQQHNVILIDPDFKKLEQASSQSDLGTRRGSGTDWQLLDDLLDLSPDFFIALTGSDETNFASCSIAKHLGYPRTIARVREDRFLNRTRLDFSHIFEVDYFIGPELLVANDILKHMISPKSIAVESLMHGAVQVRTLAIPPRWEKENIPLSQLEIPQGIIVGLILRKINGKNEIIYPHGKDAFIAGDEVTFIGETNAVTALRRFLGLDQRVVDSVTILGGSLTGQHLAKLLDEKGVITQIIEKDYDRCRYLAERLPQTTILHHDGTDAAFLRSEKIEASQVFAACTGTDEVNIVSALLGKEIGCKDTVVTLANSDYIPLAKRLGISHAHSPRISAGEHILSLITKETVSSLVSLYDNQVEIVEVQVPHHSKVVGIPLSQLGPLLPKDFLIAMIQNRGKATVAHGGRIISPGDTVIVITSHEHLLDLKKIF